MVKLLLALGALIAVVAVGGVALAGAGEEPAREVVAPAPISGEAVEDDDRPLRPDEARRARAAALRVTGGGTVAELDRSDDPGEAYEVEIVVEGVERDVALDAGFRPVPNRRYDD